MRCRNLSLFLILIAAALTAGAQTSAQLHAAVGVKAPAQASPDPASQGLTLQQAEQIAIQNHPQIQAATYLAAAAKAQVTEARSDYYPHAYGSVTGAIAENNSRVAAGALNNPIIFNRFSNGVTVEQLVTDFGRTHELVKSSNLHAKAQEESVTTSRADILLLVDAAYFNAL